MLIFFTICLSLQRLASSCHAPHNNGSIWIEHSKFSIASLVKSKFLRTIPYLQILNQLKVNYDQQGTRGKLGDTFNKLKTQETNNETLLLLKKE